MSTISKMIVVALLLAATAFAAEPGKDAKVKDPVAKNDAEWREQLTPEQYRVMREKGTEAPFSGKFNLHSERGVYVCAGCGNDLFVSDTKFEAGCGWPSYWEPVTSESVVTVEDRSHGMIRTEVLCAECGAHLGHVFPDGPRPTGLRYCINSVSLDFAAGPAEE